ncbi:MAG: peroxiredoxin-like family protein [Pseudomonadota bacterium]|nr:peroxiredoxin-like family protein [Pseudomonadota bacterium]
MAAFNNDPSSLEEAFDRANSAEVPLSEKLAAYTGSHRRLSPQVAAAYDSLVARLVEAKAGRTGPKVGELMPAFALPDECGHLTSLPQLLAGGPAVVSFNRGHWCGFCRLELRAMADVESQLAALGARIVSIVPTRAPFARQLKQDSALPFTILTDSDCGYAMSLGLTVSVGRELLELYEKRGIRLGEFQDNGGWLLPIPATFVVARNGTILARFIDPDFRKRMDIEEIVAAVRMQAAA